VSKSSGKAAATQRPPDTRKQTKDHTAARPSRHAAKNSLTGISGERPTIKPRETTMKFRVNYRITDQDKWLPVLQKWISLSPDERANDAGDGVRMIGRWHDLAGRNGTVIVESNDLPAVTRWIGKWNPYMETDLTPVFDDEESAAVARDIVAANRT
jgi:hypothetical protein